MRMEIWIACIHTLPAVFPLCCTVVMYTVPPESAIPSEAGAGHDRWLALTLSVTDILLSCDVLRRACTLCPVSILRWVLQASLQQLQAHACMYA